MSKESTANTSSAEGIKKGRGERKDSLGKGAMGRSGQGNGLAQRFIVTRFLSGAVDELKKVVHPTRQEAVQATVVTLIFMAFFGIILGLLDWALRSVIWQLL